MAVERYDEIQNLVLEMTSLILGSELLAEVVMSALHRQIQNMNTSWLKRIVGEMWLTAV